MLKNACIFEDAKSARPGYVVIVGALTRYQGITIVALLQGVSEIQ